MPFCRGGQFRADAFFTAASRTAFRPQCGPVTFRCQKIELASDSDAVNWLRQSMQPLHMSPSLRSKSCYAHVCKTSSTTRATTLGDSLTTLRKCGVSLTHTWVPKKTQNKELLFSFNADDKLPKPTTIMDDDDRRTVAWLARQICRNGLAH